MQLFCRQKVTDTKQVIYQSIMTDRAYQRRDHAYSIHSVHSASAMRSYVYLLRRNLAVSEREWACLLPPRCAAGKAPPMAGRELLVYTIYGLQHNIRISLLHFRRSVPHAQPTVGL